MIVVGVRRIDNLGRPEQLGTDRQVGGFGGIEVDFQPDFVLFSDESDHAAVLGKTVGVAYSEDVPPFQSGKDLVQPVALRAADEQDMTRLDLFHTAIALNGQGPVVDFFITHGLVQVSAERVFSQDADDQRYLPIGKGLLRPFDELREVEQENRLELVLLRGRSLGGQIPPGRERRGERDQPNCGQTSQLTRRPRPGECLQKMRHTIFPYTLRSISWRAVGSPNSAW